VRSHTTRQFRELLAELPADVQRQAGNAYRLFRADPFHQSLHLKQVSPRNTAIWSVRVGAHYRVIGLRKGEDFFWGWIGHHAEYDRLLKQM